MEGEKIKRKLKHLIKNIEAELVNITWEATIKQELPETEVLEDITAETNAKVKTYSSYMALEEEGNQWTEEDFDKHKKCELNTVILEGEQKCEDLVSNGLTPGDVSFVLNRFESSPHQNGSSSSSVSSHSSFVIVEPESSVNGKFKFDDLKEESSLSLKEFDITYNKLISKDTDDEKQSDTVAKHFHRSENAEPEQDSSLFIKEEIKGLKRTLGKCFNYLRKLETIALKRKKQHLEEGEKFSKSHANGVKIASINSDLTLSSSQGLRNNINTYTNTKHSLQEWLVHFNCYRNGYMEFTNREHHASDHCNGRCFEFEWDLDTYVIKEDGTCFIQTSKSHATENHPLNNLVASSPGEIDKVEKNWSEECYSKNNKQSNLNKAKVAENKPFKSCIPSCTNIGEKKKLWEYYRYISLHHQQQKLLNITNSTEAKNQSSNETSPKKCDMMEKEINEKLCNKKNEIVTKLERISELIDEIEKQRIIIERRQDKEMGLFCLMLLFICIVVVNFCFVEFPSFTNLAP